SQAFLGQGTPRGECWDESMFRTADRAAIMVGSMVGNNDRTLKAAHNPETIHGCWRSREYDEKSPARWARRAFFGSEWQLNESRQENNRSLSERPPRQV